jgi:hypothetical protein
MIDGECESWQKRNHDAAFPWCSILMRFYDSVNNSIADVVFDLHVVDRSSIPYQNMRMKYRPD